MNCFNTSSEEAAFWIGTIAAKGIQVKGNFSDPTDLVAFYGQASAIDSALVQLGERCMTLSGDNLKYVGTTATVRDLVALADAVDGPDSLITFWGLSYGSAIGTYFVNSEYAVLGVACCG